MRIAAGEDEAADIALVTVDGLPLDTRFLVSLDTVEGWVELVLPVKFITWNHFQISGSTMFISGEVRVVKFGEDAVPFGRAH